MRRTYPIGGMGQVMPTVVGHLRPRLAGLKENLPDIFVGGSEESLQGLVLDRIELP